MPMQRRTFCQVVGQACVAAYIGPVGLEASTDNKGRPSAASQTLKTDQKPVDEASDWATISTLLEDASSTYHEPWDDATNRTLMKGAYLGNGDLGAHLGGSRHSLIYYLGKNGFHAGNDTVGFRAGDDSAPGPYKQHILNLARLTIEAAAETAKADSPSDYSVTQDLKNAEIRTESFMAGASVKTRAYLSPSSNVLVLELSTSGGKDLHLQAALSVIGNASVAQRAGRAGSMIWVTKEPNAEGAPFYVKGAVAAQILGTSAVTATDNRSQSQLTFTLPAGGGVIYLVVQAEHTKDAPSPLASVKRALRRCTAARVAHVSASNKVWWRRFWLR